MSAPGSRPAARGIVVRVRLFAMLRERAGVDSLELSLPDGATVADALAELSRREPLGELLEAMSVAMAVNRDYADAATPLAADDELALIPPLSGGSGGGGDGSSGARERDGTRDRELHARVREDRLSADELSAAVADPSAGAIVTFQGVTRTVPRLDYEAYVEMARERIAAIVRDCSQMPGVCAVAAEHRVGAVVLGEPSVIVAASAAHRGEAFAAAREAIDRIKAQAPIWKREVERDGKRRWAPGTPAPVAARQESAADQPVRGAGGLTHLDEHGRARMVDVGGKPLSERVAIARARVRMSPAAARAVRHGDGPKGEVLSVARLAGIQAAKQTGQLIPLAHPLALTFVDVSATVDVAGGLVEILGEARTVARTGVEMEAMSACAVAALTVYDMVKGLERGVEIEQVVLLGKRGGRSDYMRRES